MNELFQYVVGSAGAWRFAGVLFFALVGLSIRLTEKSSVDFLEPWDWQDVKGSAARHLKRLVNMILTIYVLLRFPLLFIPDEVVQVVPEELAFALAVGVGYGYDRISSVFKGRINPFTTNNNGKNSQ